MFEGTGDYLAKKARQLGLERADVLRKIQNELDRLYSGQARAVSLNQGVLRIITPNASLASELRLNQVKLLQAFGPAVGRITVSIR